MEKFDGETIFWLITLGLILGGVIKLIMGSNGLNIPTNIIGGVLGTLIIGFLAIKVQIAGSMLLALAGTMAILFLGNVFFAGKDTHQSQEPNEHPI